MPALFVRDLCQRKAQALRRRLELPMALKRLLGRVDDADDFARNSKLFLEILKHETKHSWSWARILSGVKELLLCQMRYESTLHCWWVVKPW